MRWKRGDIDALSWIILLAGAISVVFYTVVMLWLTPAYGEECAINGSCTGTRWVPHVDGERLESPDLSEEQCLDVLKSLDESTPAFTRLVCVEEEIARTNS